MTAFPKEIFRIKPGCENLTKEDFEYWPAWSEYYDSEEIDLIKSWGINKRWAQQKFNDYNTGGAHPHYTILDLKNLPFENMRIYLFSEFTTPSGVTLRGRIMNSAELCIGIFTKHGEKIFIRHPMLREDSIIHEQNIMNLYSLDALFPLKFKTQFNNQEGSALQGVYTIH